jgi:hypothetical protein
LGLDATHQRKSSSTAFSRCGARCACEAAAACSKQHGASWSVFVLHGPFEPNAPFPHPSLLLFLSFSLSSLHESPSRRLPQALPVHKRLLASRRRLLVQHAQSDVVMHVGTVNSKIGLDLTKVCNFVLTVGEKSATATRHLAPILCTKMEKLLFGRCLRCLKAGFNMVAREIKRGRKKTVDIMPTYSQSRCKLRCCCSHTVPQRSPSRAPARSRGLREDDGRDRGWLDCAVREALSEALHLVVQVKTELDKGRLITRANGGSEALLCTHVLHEASAQLCRCAVVVVWWWWW